MQDERSFLSEATAVLEAMAYDGIRIDDARFERYVRAVITEYDRRGRVERAAAAYVAVLDQPQQLLAEVVHAEEQLRDALNRRK